MPDELHYSRLVGAPNPLDLGGALEEDEGRPAASALVSSIPWASIYAHIAVMRYLPATSLAWSTSHFKKLAFGYCLAKASYVGAIAWHGPHLHGHVH